MIKVVMDFAASRLHCGYAMMQPAPIKFDPEDPGHGAGKKLYAELRRKLFAYYGRLGFEMPSPRSAFVYKRL